MRAEITRQDEGFIASFERRPQQDAEKVWNMLADNHNLQHWFGELRIAESGQGGQLIFDRGDGSVEELPITDYEEGRVFAFGWGEDHVRLEVGPAEEDGAVLRLVETIKHITPQTAKDLANWHVRLDIIEAFLNGETIDREKACQSWHDEYKRLIDSMTIEFE